MYGEPGLGAETDPPLLDVSFREAVGISDQTKQFLKRFIPVRYGEGFEQAYGEYNHHFVVVVQEEKMDFDRDFWEVYNKKVNRDRAEKQWKKLSENDRVLACSGLGAYFRYLKRNTWRERMAPEVYLKDKRWADKWDEL